VTDNKGATGTTTRQVTVTVPAGPADTYGKAVYADGPRIYWRLGEVSGTVAEDASGVNSDGTLFAGVTFGRPGALAVSDTAAGFNGSDGFVSSDELFDNPTVYTEEAWFNTTTTSGGKIIGFGRNRTGLSGSYDRHVWMTNAGALVFGTYTGQLNTITSAGGLNDGQWHHVVATQSGNGMKLYVDGVLAGTNPQTQAENYPGHWKVGGDPVWFDSSSNFFAGTIDEVAIYERELSASRIAAHFTAAAPAPNQKPTAKFTVEQTNLAVTADASQSSDSDGTVAGYAWKWGDGVTGTGKSATHTYSQPGTYTVELTVTDNQGATGVSTQEVTVAAANQSPTASFTSAVTNLKVDVNAGASDDPDGTISTYAWKFGDGKTGTGQTTSHTYADPGEYTIELTVTDDDGASDVVTKTVTVTAAPNAKPVAAFTSTTSALTASFNASDSGDTDGTIVSYAWNFGDNTTGTGVTPNHTYGQAGTYDVQLTVTDDDGSTDSVTRQVTVTAPTVLASDSFNRTVTDGWGSANPGGAWTITGGAANFDVANGVGTISTNTGAGPAAYLNGVSARDVDATTQFSYNKPGTGGGVYTSLVVRRIGTSDYRLKFRATGTATTVYLARMVNNVETILATQNIAGVIAANDSVNLRLQAQGTGTTTLRAKVWIKGAAEPAAWTLTATDTTAALQNPGAVGLYNYLSGSATNGPSLLQVADFEARPLP
jgi:PKD repeat protein